MAVIGGGAVITKVAVVVCAVAVTAGGAAEVRERISTAAPAEAASRPAAPGAHSVAPVSASGVHWVQPLSFPAMAPLAASTDLADAKRKPEQTAIEKLPVVPADAETISPHAGADGAVSAAPSGGTAAPWQDDAESPASTEAAAEPTLVKEPDAAPVAAAEPAPLTEAPAAASELDEPTVEGVQGGVLAPGR